MSTISRRAVLAGVAGGLTAPAIVRAQNAPLEIQFFFPIAAAGPITKTIDGYARDFEAEHKDIAIKPVYAGNYDDTIAKAITAFKAGKAPPLAMLGAIQVFSLIDLDAIVPMDEIANGPDDKAWLNGFFPAFLANGNVDGHVWSVPFQRSTAVLYWNKDAFKQVGLDPEKPPATWTEQTDMARKLVVKSGDQVTRWGVQIPATGGTYWLYQALAEEAGQKLMNSEGTETYFDAPGVGRGAAILGAAWQGRRAGTRRGGLGCNTERLRRGAHGDDVDHHRKPDLREEQRQVSVRGGDAAGRQTARHADGRGEFPHLFDRHEGRTRSLAAVHQVGHVAGARRSMEHRHGLCCDPAGCLGHLEDEGLRRRVSASGGRTRSASVCGAGAFDPR